MRDRQTSRSGPTTPTWQRLPSLTPCRFRLYPFRSPLLGASLLFSLPQGTEMFHFPWFPLPALCVQAGVTRHDPCQVIPFGDPRIKASLAAPRGLSQPATSFIGFQRLGIHRVPFNTCCYDARARYGVLKVHGWTRRAPARSVSPSGGLARGSPRIHTSPAGRVKGAEIRGLQSCTVCPTHTHQASVEVIVAVAGDPPSREWCQMS